jgi:hypothetical protein
VGEKFLDSLGFVTPFLVLILLILLDKSKKRKNDLGKTDNVENED